MNNEILPVGTIIKNKQGKIGMISGYKSNNIYAISPYPLSSENQEKKDFYNIIKKYDWYDYKFYEIKDNEIEEILFLGYKGNEYNEVIEVVNNDWNKN